MTTAPHPLVARAHRLAHDLLAPHAERVDQETVPASHIDAVRRSGLLGVGAPTKYGGSAAPAAVARETAEILAGACCSTWFVQTQHHTPVKVLATHDSPVREKLLRPWPRASCWRGSRTPMSVPFPGFPYEPRPSPEAGGSTAPCPGTRAGG